LAEIITSMPRVPSSTSTGYSKRAMPSRVLKSSESSRQMAAPPIASSFMKPLKASAT
jgi:hypothetical protein